MINNIKHVFIDLGSHYGKVIRKFIDSKLYNKDFIIHAFEPNTNIPNSVFLQYPEMVIIHKEAAWINDGELDLFIHPNPHSEGSSICKEKITGGLNKNNPIKIKCIDFSKWLNENFSIEDDIILKMNIEGAEYTLLPKMIESGSIKLIKKLYLFHHWYKIKMEKEIDTDLMNKLSEIPNLLIFNDNCSF